MEFLKFLKFCSFFITREICKSCKCSLSNVERERERERQRERERWFLQSPWFLLFQVKKHTFNFISYKLVNLVPLYWQLFRFDVQLAMENENGVALIFYRDIRNFKGTNTKHPFCSLVASMSS